MKAVAREIFGLFDNGTVVFSFGPLAIPPDDKKKTNEPELLRAIIDNEEYAYCKKCSSAV